MFLHTEDTHLYKTPRRKVPFSMRNSLSLIILVLTPLLSSPTLTAESVDRPKVGLALSGGGTKAGAHIGVLRVLEE